MSTTTLTPLFWVKNILIIGLSLSLTGTLLLWLLEPHTLPLTKVQIEGTLINIDPQDLQAVVSRVTMGGLLSLDVAAVRRVLLSIPWIQDVRIYRRWPDTLLIQIQEREAVAYWHDKTTVDSKGHLIVDPKGHLFVVPPRWNKKGEIRNKEGSYLPRFKGPSGSAKLILERYYPLKKIIQLAGLKIKEFGCDSRQAWYMVLNQGFHLQLGRGNSEQRVQRFLQVYQRIITPFASLCAKAETRSPLCQKPSGNNLITQIDLRYTNGIAVRKPLAE
ncbi:cell division protein FtsQ [Thioploca ingrica]|uniref:Cell division protein FtsQ n=1 Tax=Thioploca ingrica TaxID=40754 RepID=A0A090AFG2_9GAMM|nr:cell division protein FtsQ [Thioploca ingrica]